MARYAICKIIGDGKDVLTAFRPSIADVPSNPPFNFEVHMTTKDGKPVTTQCIVTVKDGDVTVVAGNPDIAVLPDLAPDVKLTPQESQDLKDILIAKNIDPALVGSDDTFTQVLDKLKLIDASVAEPAPVDVPVDVPVVP